MDSGNGAEGGVRQWWYVLLLVPFIATLWVPFYGKAQPALGGAIPFFYWWMFLWVILSAIITGFVYFVTK